MNLVKAGPILDETLNIGRKPLSNKETYSNRFARLRHTDEHAKRPNLYDLYNGV